MAYLILISLFFWSCTTAPKIESEVLPNKPQVQYSSQDSLRIAKEYFIKALDFNLQGKNAYALSTYQFSYKFSPNSKYLGFLIAGQLLEQDKHQEALSYAHKAYSQPGDTTSEHNLILGSLFQKQEEPDSAIIYLERAYKQNPDDRRALYTLGSLYEEKKDYPNLAKLNLVLTRMTQYEEQFVQRQILLLNIIQDKEQLLAFLRELWTETSNSEWGYKLAQTLRQNKIHVEALSVSQQLNNLEPFNIRYKALYTQSLIDNNEREKALVQLKALRQMNPEQSVYLARTGQLEYELGQKDSAFVHLKQLTQIDSTSHLSWFYLSALYAGAQPQKAHNAIDQAIIHLPSSFLYKNQKALLYAYEGHFQKAEDLLSKLISDNPKQAAPLEYSATYYLYRAGKDTTQSKHWQEKALTSLEQAHAIQSSARLLFELGALSGELKNFSKLELYFDELITLDSSNHQALNFLGYTLIEKDLNYEKGSNLITQALKLEPSNLAYLDSKAWYFYKVKDYASALKILHFIEAEEFDDPTLFEHLALAYEGLKDLEKAKQYWELLKEKYPKYQVPARGSK